VRKVSGFLLSAFVLLAIVVIAPIAAASSTDDPPLPATLAPASVTPAAAVLHGTIDDTGHVVTFWFEYGTTTDYGSTTGPWMTKKSHLDFTRGLGGLTQGTTYHVRLVAANEHGVAYGNDVTFTTVSVPAASPNAAPADGADGSVDDKAGPPVSAPAIGESINVAPSTGSVLVRVPGAPRAVPLTQVASVPVGALVDTRRGSVQLRTQVARGKTQTGTFHGGLFEVRQPKGSGGMTELVLRGALPTCGAGGARAAATMAKRPPRRLWGRDDHGKFRTRASNSVATVRGTAWYTEDRCDGTLTRVTKGSVGVRDLHTGRTVVVRAGHSYLAKDR